MTARRLPVASEPRSSATRAPFPGAGPAPCVPRGGSRSRRGPAAALAALFALTLAACGGAGTGVAPPEQHRIPGLTLDEQTLTARIQGEGLVVSVPLTPDDRAKGDLTVELVDLTGDTDRVVDVAKTTFDLQSAGRIELTLRDPTTDQDPATSDAMAGYLLRYEATTGQGRIFGARDLWNALPRAELQLLAPAELPAGGSVPARVFARDASDGSPLVDAEVEILWTPEGGTAGALATGRTDAHGALTLALGSPDAVAAGTLTARLRSDGGAGAALTAEVARPIQVVRDQTVLLSTDKPRYQPGQTVHLRALALDRTRGAPAADDEVLFEVLDAKGNKIFKERVRTDGFGIGAVRLPLADEVNFGAWKVRAGLCGDTAEACSAGRGAEREILVERYTLPSFAVEVATEKAYYRPGDTVQGTAAAHYFFGRPVDGQIVVEAQIDDRALATSSGTLVDGGFTFRLDLPASVGADGPVRLGLVARVTDTASQTVDGVRSLPISAGDLDVHLFPEGPLANSLPVRVMVAVTDPLGTPVAASVEIDAALTGDAGLQPVATLDLGAEGIGSFELTPSSGDARLSVTARAADGREVSRDLDLGAIATDAILIRTDRAVYAVGESMSVQVLATAGAPSRVAVDLARSGRPVLTREVELIGGRGSLVIPVGPELAGAVTLQATATGAGGRLLSASRAVLVDAGDALSVQISAEPVAPGEAATIRLKVTDVDGRGVAAAVGLAVVDPAVLALPGARPGDEAVRVTFGESAPLSVAGHGVGELLADGPTREAAARLLFAASGGGATWGIDANSLRESLAGVRTVVQPRFARTIADLRTALIADVRAGVLTDENAPAVVVEKARSGADVFGRRLEAAADGWQVTVKSRGPDEVTGTPDDLSSSLDLWSILSEGGYYDRGGWWGGEDADFDGAEGGPPAPTAEPGDASGGSGDAAAARVRSWFPETLLVAPSVLTDGAGEAVVPLTAADTITTWKVAASASDQQARLGSGEGDLVVFQDFFVDVTLPPTLTKDDEVEVPVAVYNYRDTALTVNVRALPEAWYELLSPATRTLTVEAGAVAGTRFRVRAHGVGVKGFGVEATAGTVADAIRRSVLVEPGGERVEGGGSGRLGEVAAVETFSFPASAIEGGNTLRVKIYPGVMAQTVEGMDAILSEPHGCFEQSTSSTWPNTMVMAYLDATGSGTPEVREKAMDYIRKGYQLLVSYESPSGGFNWWGDSDPGNKILTALGLLILQDMQGLIEVDPDIVRRSADWLAAQQLSDGSWPEGDALHMGNDFLSEDAAIVSAFATQALVAAGGHDAAVQKGVSYLRRRTDAGIDAPFTLAIAARALAESGGTVPTAVLADLDAIAQLTPEGHAFWSGPENRSWTGSTGSGAGVETTAVAAQALLAGGAYPETVSSALDWLAANKNALGTWSQTQATVQALRAFTRSVTGAGAPDVAGDILVTVDGTPVGTLSVTPGDSEVVRVLDLSELATPGEHQVQLELVGRGTLMYQVAAVHHLPWGTDAASADLQVTVSHGATDLAVGETDPVTVSLQSRAAGDMEQVLVKVGLPPGFTANGAQLDASVQNGRLSRWERSATGVVLYVPLLRAGETLAISFDAAPALAGDLEAPATVAYRYYEPEVRAVAAPVPFAVRE